ncbi:MFS transporter [Desulfonatronovibrio magnus]|uniref:MFS transporter n=1 Tax=Desulfonatronovibrio magnus TaxID=698827 RepID=UPI0005EBAED6|nr:hypothetical protein [Desulfonatronovibrio magnus]
MNNTKMASRREIFGWAMFDFANQAYTTLIITVIYGVLFTRVIVGDAPDFRVGNLLWSVSLCLSYAMVVIMAPVCGAIMDHSRSKKKFLFVSYVVTILTCFCLKFSCFFWGMPSPSSAPAPRNEVHLSNAGFTRNPSSRKRMLNHNWDSPR